MKGIGLLASGICLFYLVSCSGQAAEKGAAPAPATNETAAAGHDYAAARRKAEALRKQLLTEYQAAPAVSRTAVLDKAGDTFTQIFDEYITPAWMGTPWDFNGTTQAPGKGRIACGYFVTTILRDAGVKLNRVKLAQCASGKIIGNLISKANTGYLGQLSYDDFIKKIKGYGRGVYIVGLDFHTGFLLHDGREVYFVHSNYINRKGVVKETMATSAALRASKYRLVGRLTQDTPFLTGWLSGKQF
jgi:hypothetical protein